MKIRTAMKRISVFILSVIFTLQTYGTAFAYDLHDGENAFIEINSENLDNGTTKWLTLSDADKAKLPEDFQIDEVLLTTLDDLFYFTSAEVSADLSKVSVFSVITYYFEKNEDGEYWISDLWNHFASKEEDGQYYDNYWSNFIIKEKGWDSKNIPITYGEKFSLDVSEEYSKNNIFRIRLEAEDTSWVYWDVIFDKDMFEGKSQVKETTSDSKNDKTTEKTANDITYVVKKGDTMGNIATNYYGNNAGHTLLFNYNAAEFKKTKGKLVPGMTLKIPEKLGKQARINEPVAAKGEKLYTVKAGDTLFKIAAKQLGDGNKYSNIFNKNKDRLSKASLIYEGQVIVIPAK